MRTSGKKRMTVLAVVAGLCVALGGCAMLQEKDKSQSPGASQPAGNVQRYEPAPPTSVYYDFKDVLFPSELKLDKKNSSVYVTDGFKAGVLTLTGRVETGSLVSWFENNMVKDNWRLVSSLKAQRTRLLFVKPNRYCVINVTDGGVQTQVDVWVAPTVGETQEPGRLQ